MSKKMKGVDLDPSPYGAYEDAKARFKHQTLIQDYKELQKEAEAMRNKLETLKHRKLTLLAEVGFLHRRYKYLLKIKTINPPQARRPVQSQNFETQSKSTVKEKIYRRKKIHLQNLATFLDVNQKEMIIRAKESACQSLNPRSQNQKDLIRSGKEATFRNKTPFFDLNQKERSNCGNEVAFQNPVPIHDLKQKGRLYSGKDTSPRNPAPSFDLNQIERSYVQREDVIQSQPPLIDLNEISGEDSELPDSYEPLKFVIRGGNDEQHNDLKLSVCRKAVNGPNRGGKRKISWQDQVALKV